jgi:hypothetical protein
MSSNIGVFAGWELLEHALLSSLDWKLGWIMVSLHKH